MFRGRVISIAVVLAALCGVAAVFTFARPEYHSRYESKMIDFSKERYSSPASVRGVFAVHGIRLYGHAEPDGRAWFGGTPPPFQADSLQVLLMPRKGTGSWGPKLEAYDERFGNVLVTYGGHDERLLDRVKAAVGDLR